MSGSRWSEPGEGESRNLKLLAALLFSATCLGFGVFGIVTRHLPNLARRNPRFDLHGAEAVFFGSLLVLAGVLGAAYAAALWRERP